MTLCESKSDNNILEINNLIESFTTEFKKSYNALKFNKNINPKKKVINKKIKKIPKRPNKSIILNPHLKYKTINPHSTPVEFYYEFHDFIKGGKPKNSKNINNNNKKTNNNYNNNYNSNNNNNYNSNNNNNYNSNNNNNYKNNSYDNNYNTNILQDKKEVPPNSKDNNEINDIQELNNNNIINNNELQDINEFQDNNEDEANDMKELYITERKNKSHKNLLDNKNGKKPGKIIYRNGDRFWNKVKYYMDLKNEHLSELTYRYKMKSSNNIEENKSNKKLNKSSFLLYPTNRKPLYPYQNIDEDSLSKNFENFYKFFQKEQKLNNNKLYKRKKDIDYINNDISYNSNNNKFKHFYDKTMKWIKKRDDKINLERNMLEEKDKRIMNSFSFRPHIDKNSVELINKRNDFINFMENKPNTERNYSYMMTHKKEIYQKYLATIKPYMAFYYENNSPYLKKYSHSFTKRRSNVDIGMIHINKGKNIILTKDKSLNNTNDKSIIEKNNDSYIGKRNIFNIFKPDKKHLTNNKNKNIQNNSNKTQIIRNNNIKQKFWWQEIKKKKYKKEEKKLDFNDLYKVNVRDNSSWNKICINKIFSKPRDKEVINDFI